MNESWRAGAPMPFLTVNTVGPTIMEFGTEEQKGFFLPKILAGELHFSIGYTEPDAGTDLASLTTKAVKDGDEWVINGQKIYTSLASYADYIWLAARTDPDAPKHRGITMFVVPTTDPGFSYSKISTMVNASTFNTFYDDVRVGDDAVIGGVNRGWDLIINQLNYERVSLGPPGHGRAGLRGGAVAGPRTTTLPDGRRVIDQEWVQVNLARVRAGLEFLSLLNWKVAAAGGRQPGRRQRHQGVRHRVLHRGLPAADGGPRPQRLPGRGPRRASSPAASSGRTRAALILTFGGGVNEIQRDLIAMFGLGMPRMPTALRSTMDFTLTDEQTAIATWPPGSSRAAARRSGSASSSRPATGSPPTSGPSWPGRPARASPARGRRRRGLRLLRGLPARRAGRPHRGPGAVCAASCSAPCRSPSSAPRTSGRGCCPA